MRVDPWFPRRNLNCFILKKHLHSFKNLAKLRAKGENIFWFQSINVIKSQLLIISKAKLYKSFSYNNIVNDGHFILFYTLWVVISKA